MRTTFAAWQCLALVGASLASGDPPSFTRQPTAERTGEQVRIKFAVSRPTDVAVCIEDAKGRIVRHLAAGALGDSAPAPLAAGSLQQSLPWDGKDDAGRDCIADPARGPFKAVVGLGLAHTLDRIIGWDPLAIQKIYSLAVGPEGRLYVLWAQPETVSGPPQVAVLDREGTYQRTILPYPASLPPDRIAGIAPIRLADGSVVPRVYHGLASTFYPWLSGTCRQTMTVTAKGRLVVATGHFNYSTAGSMGPRRLLSVNLDGSCPESFAGPVLDKRLWGGKPVEGFAHVAASPDGEFAYVSGLYETNDWAKEHLPSCVVLRARLAGGSEDAAEVFFGERGKAGDDETHLSDPRGVAADGEGNLLVADYGNNRIVKLSPAGKFIGRIAVDSPDQIAVNRRTGAIYVVSVHHGQHGPFTVRGWQDKKVLKIRSWAEPKVVARVEGFNKLNAMVIAVDDAATPPVLWIALAYPDTYHGNGRGLFRCVDRGDSFTQPVPVLGPEARPAGLSACEYVAVDPVREQIHVRGDAENSARAWFVFDGRTGENLGLSKLRPVGEERAFDAEGRLYTLYGAGASNGIARWSADAGAGGLPDFRPAPFDGADRQAATVTGGMKARPRGFCVAASGDIYVLHYPGDPWKPDGMRTAVTVLGPDGTVKRTEVITSMRTAASIRVDRAGNLYIAENVKTARRPFPAELGIGPRPGGRIWGPRYDHSAWYPWLYGGIVKFGPEGGRIERAAGGEYFTGWPDWDKDKGAVRVTGAKWVRPGMAPVPAADQACVCGAGRFDLDRFGRVYLPDAGRCRVAVLDSAGNELCHFGGYGNMDSRGPGSLEPAPAIPLAWPGCVAVSPEAVYVSDWLNVRVVRVRPSYAAEAACPVP